MSTKKVLIITHTQDNSCINTVMDMIQQAGGEAIRFDCDRYPLDSKVSTIYKDGQWKVIFDNGTTTVDLNDVTSVWFRRSYNIGSGVNTVLEKEYIPAAM